jgi:hypothetical protein
MVPVAAIYRYVNFRVNTQSGNIQYGVVRLSGTGRTSYDRIVHSGIIACPASGIVRGDLGAFSLAAGDHAAFLWADNTTFQTHNASSSGGQSLRACATHDSLATGVQATGTITFAQQYVVMSIEADV